MIKRFCAALLGAVLTLSLLTGCAARAAAPSPALTAEEAQAIALEQENSRLQQAIDQLGTIQGIAYIAKEQLGLVDPDTIIIEPEN